MDAESTVGMTEDTGVTSSAETPTSTAEASPPSESQNGEPKPSEKPKEEFVSRAEYNKRAEAERKLQAKYQRLEQQWNSAQNAVWFENWLRQDPKRIAAVEALIKGDSAPQQQPQQPTQDQFAEFDPIVQEQFRTVQELRQWQQKMMQLEQTYQQQQVQQQQQVTLQTQNDIDRAYDERLTKDGLLDSQGNPVNAEFVDLVNDAVFKKLIDTAKIPERPTMAELDKAYKSVMSGLKYSERRGLKKAVQPNVPPTGSRSGMPALQKGKLTQKDRINNITNALNF